MGNTLKCNWQDGLGTSPTGEQCGECSPEFANRCPALNKEKQIEEMAEAIFQNCQCGLWFSEAEQIADFVINQQGYRKASEVAREIIEEAEKIFMFTCSSLEAYTDWQNFKKKYTEEGK